MLHIPDALGLRCCFVAPAEQLPKAPPTQLVCLMEGQGRLQPGGRSGNPGQLLKSDLFSIGLGMKMVEMKMVNKPHG